MFETKFYKIELRYIYINKPSGESTAVETLGDTSNNFDAFSWKTKTPLIAFATRDLK